jgi:nitroreductase
MNTNIKSDRYLMGQQIRFLAHMLSVAMKSFKPDLNKKKDECDELEELLQNWREKKYAETPDIHWAIKMADRFRKWINNPKIQIIQPDDDHNVEEDKNLERIIRTRRSVRYWTRKLVPDEYIERILEAGLYAPSAFNRLPWRFFVAKTPPDQLEEGDASNPGMFRQAPVRIFVAVDERLFFEKYSGALDAGLAMQNMLLVAHNLGLATCLIYQGEFVDKKMLEKHYHIPEYCTTYCAILLGYPNEVPEIPARMPLKEVTEYLGEVPNPEF